MDVLEGAFVRLEPLGPGHLEGLLLAAAEDRSTYGFTTVPGSRDEAVRYVDELVADDCIAFAQVRLTDEAVIGCTRFMNLRTRTRGETPYAVEIGGTWLASSAQGTAINSEAKLLMLTYAFDHWKVKRVDLQTDARNERSRAGILGIGAVYEGTLRKSQPSRAEGEEGMLRDSAIFSITDDEWPSVRAHLVERIAKR